MHDFNFIIPLQKSVTGGLTGIASTTSRDRDDERMSVEAINQMAMDIRQEGVNLFGNHEHGWENVLGGIDNANVLMNKQLQININPNRANPKYSQLIGTLNTKGVRLGLSVAGNVEHFNWEYDRELGKKIKVMDKVKIYEVSIVGIPSNQDSFLTIPQAIAKSAKLPALKKCGICFNKTMMEVCEICLAKV